MGVTKLVIEERRNRQSTTQGSLSVHVNGEEVCVFVDNIQRVDEDREYYGQCIGGYASIIPDGAAIHGLLYSPLDNVYHLSHKVKKLIPCGDIPMLEIQCNRDDVKIAKVVDGAWECPTCGKLHKEKGNFCTRCGQRVAIECTGRSDVISRLLNFYTGTRAVINNKNVECKNWSQQKYIVDCTKVKV